MTYRTRALFRHRPLRIAGGVWLALLFGGALAVQRGSVLAELAAPLGLGATGARIALGLIAAAIGFALGYGILTLLSRDPVARRPERDAEPAAPPAQGSEPVSDEEVASEIYPAPEEPEEGGTEFAENATLFAEAQESDDAAFDSEPPATGVTVSAPKPARSLREAWMLHTGEELESAADHPGPSDAPDLPSEPEPEPEAEEPMDQEPAPEPHDPAPAVPTLDELQQRLIEAIGRLEHVDARQGPRVSHDPPPDQHDYRDEPPLLDESARQAVKDALARLEGFASGR